MDVGGARKFRVSSRSLVVIISLATMLVASGTWNIRQYRLIEHQRQRVLVAEREEAARAAAESERAEARRKKKAEYAASDARMKQLYREITNLSRANEHVLSQPLVPQTRPSDEDGQQTATAARESTARPPL